MGWRALFHRSAAAAALSIGAVATTAFAQAETLLLRQPSLGERHIAFIYAGDVWVADRSGANPRRLTTHPADERQPHLSPDGAWIAFTSNAEQNADVYVVPVAGGQPKRLTYHPGADIAQGWTADGRVLFSSARAVNHGRSAQAYAIAPDATFPEKLMEARFFSGDFDDSGARLAFLPFGPAYNALYGGTSGWRQHRGGTTPSITILDVKAQSAVQIPGERLNDLNPMWVGGQVYFLSDRDGISLALHRFDPASGQVDKVASAAPWDMRWASAHGQTIAFEAGGRLHLFDVAAGTTQALAISLAADAAQIAPRWEDLARNFEDFSLSPTGQRALISARGEAFTVPTGKDGSTRNVTASGSLREYTPLWSPDGAQIALIVDDGKGQRLRLIDQKGLAPPRDIALPSAGAFHRLGTWTSDGKHIVFEDNNLNLYLAEIASGAIKTIDSHARFAAFNPASSPDGAWIAYVREQSNGFGAIQLYEIATGRKIQVGDGLADQDAPVFSRDGAYLYFAASVNHGPAQFGLNMQSRERPQRYGLYAAVLSKDGASPFLRKAADEEVKSAETPAVAAEPARGRNRAANGAAANAAPEAKADKPKATKVDSDGLSARIVAFPLAERAYGALMVGEDNALYYIDGRQPGASYDPPGSTPGAENRLMRYDFAKREASPALTGVLAASISRDGKKILLQPGPNRLAIADIGATLKPEPLNLGDLRAKIYPREEWAFIFDETWRMEREYFYAENLHGLDWTAIGARYRPLLGHVTRREDLNALLAEMIGEMQVGHNRIGGGDVHQETPAPVGLLGADYSVAQGHYRFEKIYAGEQWTPFLRAPLGQPGLNVKAGDFLIAINGRDLTSADNIHAAMQGTVDKQTILLVNDRPSRDGAREITVEPIANEQQLRLWSWVETNRREVLARSNGRVGYVYLPNTAEAGFDLFNRMYYAQAHLDGIIFDERANGGGQAADYVVDVLSAGYLGGWRYRAGIPNNTPTAGHYGPKVMLIDQDAGSGGDFLPYAFRRREIGPLIGKRTWGGLIGISANPALVDGGNLTVPYFRFYSPEGEWRIENEGTPPDIDVALDPVATNQGRDTQLERGLAEVLRALEGKGPQARLTAPPLPTEPGK
ncbi:MAG TPA: peptidase S41 [Hyphomonadaceae bacterium]|nr:peptidase S41 [Hyphomonadaceae bacterium]